MPDGGTLTVSVREGEDPATGAAQVAIVFRDEGVGMDESQCQRYFQPFSSSFDEGTGLGAAIVYRLVEEHGGRIQLSSRPGEGTEVTILLPRRPAASAPAPTPEPRLVAAGGGTR